MSKDVSFWLFPMDELIEIVKEDPSDVHDEINQLLGIKIDRNMDPVIYQQHKDKIDGSFTHIYGRHIQPHQIDIWTFMYLHDYLYELTREYIVRSHHPGVIDYYYEDRNVLSYACIHITAEYQKVSPPFIHNGVSIINTGTDIGIIPIEEIRSKTVEMAQVVQRSRDLYPDRIEDEKSHISEVLGIFEKARKTGQWVFYQLW